MCEVGGWCEMEKYGISVGYRVYTSRLDFVFRSKSPNPLEKGALGGFLGFSLLSKLVYTR
jgi:hypothetical protein